jgi:hypothetical protein
MTPDDGVSFPEIAGERSTSSTGRAILADAVRPADPGLAGRIEDATDWRHRYVPFVRELTEVSATTHEAALAIAQAGLASVRSRMVFVKQGQTTALPEALSAGPSKRFSRREIRGGQARVPELRVPYRDQELAGPALIAQLERWVGASVVEPSFAAAIQQVVEHPEWLALEGRRIALIGAGAELSPLEPLSNWGADVIALDLPRAEIWERIETIGRQGAGTLTIPLAADGTPGLDVAQDMPEAGAWIGELAGDDNLVLGMYAYADGGMHVRVTAAVDVITADLLERRPSTGLAYLATPTDAFVVPQDVVTHARSAYASRRLRRVAQAPLRLASRGRLFAPAYPGESVVADVLVEQQGPNYALAKRIQRWRGVAASEPRRTVSFNVAPAAWTRSVIKNRILAAAYAGARRFGVEIFAPDTSRVLMAALLVHDLNAAPPRDRHPEALFSDGAAHGGLWRAGYQPRSVLGLAALTGLPGTLRR